MSTRSQPESLADTLLTVAEAAAILGVSTRTIERLRKSGNLRHVTVGSGPRPRIYYAQGDVLTHLANREGRARDHDQPLPEATA